MAHTKKPVGLSLLHENIARLEDILEKKDSVGRPLFKNKSDVANELIKLGYHAWYAMNPMPNPNLDPELLRDINEMASTIYVAQYNKESDD